MTGTYSYPHYTEIRDHATSFSGVLGHAARPLALQLSDVTEQIEGAAVSGNFFDVLGLTPAAGRFFAADEDVPGSPANVVVVSHQLWQQRLGGRADAVGSTINLNGQAFTVVGVRTLEDHIRQATAEERMAAQVAAGFSIAALLLAAVGLYGLLAYFVAQHRREVGIRMALGADRGDVLTLVLRKGLALAGVGIIVGLPAAWIGSRLVQSLMYGVPATDPISYATAAITLAVVATLAAVIPARRASGVDPMVALRQE